MDEEEDGFTTIEDNKIKNPNKRLVNPSELLEHLRSNTKGVLLTIGAGDIDRMVEPIKELLQINDSAL